MKVKAFLYCFKIWITAICSGTAIHAINSIFGFYDIGVDGFKVLGWIAFIIVLGGGLAVPSLILFWLALSGIRYIRCSKTSTQIYLSFISTLVCLLQFIIGNSSISLSSLAYSTPYLLIALAGILYYKYPLNPYLIERTRL